MDMQTTDTKTLATGFESEPERGARDDETNRAEDEAACRLMRAFVDRLRSSDEKAGGVDLSELFEDDAEEASTTDEGPALLSPDTTLAAALAADFGAVHANIVQSLRKEAPVVALEVASKALIDDVKLVVSQCLLPAGSRVADGDPRPLPTAGQQKCFLLCHVTGTRFEKDAEDLIEEAQAKGAGVILLAHDEDALTAEALEMVDHASVLRLRPVLIPHVIEASFGRLPTEGELRGLETATLEDWRLCLSASRGLELSLRKLARRIEQRRRTEKPVPKLSQLAGFGNVRQIGLDIAGDLRAYARGTLKWEEIDPGLVLSGDPGTGKTYFAQALAAEAGLPFVLGSMSAWQACEHLGQMLKNMRRTFQDARQKAPCVLFLDEFDGIGRRDQFHERHRDYSTQVVNAALEFFDGTQSRHGVFAIAATNAPDRIDPALLRAGRLDRVVHLTLPTAEELVGILRTLLGDDLADASLDPVGVALRGRTPADTAATVRRGRSSARQANRPLDVGDLVAAARDGRELPKGLTRRRVCIHEAGHAVAAAALAVGGLHALVLTPTGGHAELETKRDTMETKDSLERIIAFLLAGRAAERLLLRRRSWRGRRRPQRPRHRYKASPRHPWRVGTRRRRANLGWRWQRPRQLHARLADVDRSGAINARGGRGAGRRSRRTKQERNRGDRGSTRHMRVFGCGSGQKACRGCRACLTALGTTT